MSNPSYSKRKGREAENNLVAYLRARGYAAERRRLAGAYDKGDIAGLPQVTVEVKSAARLDLAGWLAEAEREQANTGDRYGVVWAKPRGVTDPGRWYVVMSGDQFMRILEDATNGSTA